MKKFLQAIGRFFIQIRDFFLCLLQAECIYSIKKFLVYCFSVLVIYLAVCTDKSYIDLLVFIAALLGIRSYERLQNKSEQQKDVNIKKD